MPKTATPVSTNIPVGGDGAGVGGLTIENVPCRLQEHRLVAPSAETDGELICQ